MSSEAARALGRKRWAGSTPEERKAFSEQGASKGGRAAWAGLTSEQRSEIMRERAAKRRLRKRR